MTIEELRQVLTQYNDDTEIRVVFENENAVDGWEWGQLVGILPSGLHKVAIMVCTDDVVSEDRLFDHVKESEFEELWEGEQQ